MLPVQAGKYIVRCRTYLGPRWPSSILGAKRMVIFLTSLGSTAAPGPSLIARSCLGQKGGLRLVVFGGDAARQCEELPAVNSQDALAIAGGIWGRK